MANLQVSRYIVGRITGFQVYGLALSALFLSGLAGVAFAQTLPNAGSILQDARQQGDRPPPSNTAPIEVPPRDKPAQAAQAGDVRVQVTGFHFVGNHKLTTAMLEAIVAQWSGRSLSYGELIQVVEAVEARYKEAGYFLAQAYLPPQKIHDGVIEIAVTETQLAKTRLEGESRVRPEVLYRYLDRIPKGEALLLPVLERQVLLVNELAGNSSSLDLQAGDVAGTTDVVLVQHTERAIDASVNVNNYGAPSTGQNRLALNLDANSPFGYGERVSANVLGSDSSGLFSYSLRTDVPFGAAGWRLTANASRSQYSLGGSFSSLQASGTANSLRLGASYPLVRSRLLSLKLALEADQNQLEDTYQSTGMDLTKQSSGLTATLALDRTDASAGNGSTHAEISLRGGTMNLGSAALAQDAPPTGPGVNGAFSKLNIAAQRTHAISSVLSLQFQLTAQFASGNLDSSEKMSMGGAGIMPGYPSGVVTGDSGMQVRGEINGKHSRFKPCKRGIGRAIPIVFFFIERFKKVVCQEWGITH